MARHRGPLHLAGAPWRSLPPSGRAQPAAHHGDQHGGHPSPPGAPPPGSVHVAVTGTAMISGSPTRPAWPRPGRSSRATGTTPTRRSGEPGARPPNGSGGAVARDARHRACAGRPVRRRDPRLPGPVPREDGACVEMIGTMNRLLADWCRVGRIGRGDRCRGRRSGVDAHARRNPGSLRGWRRERRRPRARERRALPSRQPLLGCRSRPVRTGLRAERDRMGRAAPPTRLSRTRVRTAPPVSSLTSSESSRSASRMVPTVPDRGTTSRRLSSARKTGHQAATGRGVNPDHPGQLSSRRLVGPSRGTDLKPISLISDDGVAPESKFAAAGRPTFEAPHNPVVVGSNPTPLCQAVAGEV